MNKDLQKLFNNLKDTKQESLHRDSKVLIVDSLNTFLRSFVMIHHLNPQGNHIGGLTGYLKSVGHAVRLIEPTRVILVFDGHGGSTNKRYLYPEYKANRKITKISNWDAFDNQEEESESITNQIVRLVSYLKCLPVDLLVIDKIEADDVIGHLTRDLPEKVVIYSSDKDYLQLVSDRVTVFSPIKKKFYTPKAVKEEFGLPPQNFLTQKILLGDTSDNVPGVKGLGLKTLLKMYPDLSNEDPITLEQILEESRDKKGRYGNVINFKHQLGINRLLMDLSNPNIPSQDQETIQELLDNPNSNLDMISFLRLYNEDNLGNSIPNTQMWLYDSFGNLRAFKKK